MNTGQVLVRVSGIVFSPIPSKEVSVQSKEVSVQKVIGRRV